MKKIIAPIIIIFGLVFVFTALSLTGCGNGTTSRGGSNGRGGKTGGKTDDMGQISIRVGSSTTARTAWTRDGVEYETDDFTHVITLNGPAPTQSATIKPHTTETANFTVKAGNWTINVDAIFNNEIVATGSKPVTIKAGEKANVSITMSATGGVDVIPQDPGTTPTDPGNDPGTGTTTDPDYDFTVTNTPEWNAALTEIKNIGTGDFTIGIKNSITIAASTSPTFGSGTGLKITIFGNGKNISTGTTMGSVLFISNNQSVTLENVNLSAGANNNSVVYINGGELTMNSGKISGNRNSTPGTSGGGVNVLSGGTFTMNGGEISGNTGVSGGGVALGIPSTNGGTFTMNGGTISGNTATNNGGGVYIRGTTNNTVFTMNGGTISGNNATNGGASLYINPSFLGKAQYGNGTDIITDGTNSSDTTIIGHN